MLFFFKSIDNKIVFFYLFQGYLSHDSAYSGVVLIDIFASKCSVVAKKLGCRL